MAKSNTLQDLVYSDLLQPSLGYEVVFAVGCTYSLSFEGLLSVPMAFGLLGEMDETTKQTPAYLLESIRRSSDKFIVFCNKGGILVPPQALTLYSLLEGCIQEVVNKDKPIANFHPKVWIIKERHESGGEQIKIIILSRNLTYTNDIDVVVSMRGQLLSDARRKYCKPEHQPLQDFLLELSNSLVASQKKNQLLTLADDIVRLDTLDVSDPFVDYAFYPNYFGQLLTDTKPLQELLRAEQLMIVSPFVDESMLEFLCGRTLKHSRKILLTHRENVTQRVLNCFDEVYIENDAMLENNVASVRLHAKMYLTQTSNPKRYHLYLGSANATQKAFKENSEMMIGLEFKQLGSGDRFEMIRDEILGSENRYIQVTQPTVDTAIDKRLEQEADKVLKQAMLALKSATVNKGDEGELFNIELKTNKVVIKHPIHITPLHCPAKKQLIQWGAINLITEIPGLYLSEFYVLEIKIDDLYKSVLCKVSTKNMPNDRDRWIYKDMIDTREKFMNYVSLMLSDEPSLLLSNEEFVHTMSGSKSNPRNYTYVEIYEQLLCIANTNPQRLLDMNKLVLHLDAEVIPKEFVQMLTQFQKILKHLERL